MVIASSYAQRVLVILDSKNVESTVDVCVEETSRQDSVSILKITRSAGPSMEESMFAIRTMCMIARDRNKNYFVIVSEGEDKKGVYTYIVGFLDTPVYNLKGLFGVTKDKPVAKDLVINVEETAGMFGW